jgi:hypothetical protein
MYDSDKDSNPTPYRNLSDAEREQRTEDECEAADAAAHRLYRSPLADLITQTVNDLTAELEAIATKLPTLCTAVEDMEAAEVDIDEGNPLANFSRNLDDCFAQEAREAIVNLDEVISGLQLIAGRIRYAQGEVK